jgi:hypothetical protein
MVAVRADDLRARSERLVTTRSTAAAGPGGNAVVAGALVTFCQPVVTARAGRGWC